MIFLTVGNWHKGFDRLVRAVDNLKKQGVIQDDIFGQIGSGNYKPDNYSYCEYCSPEQFSEYMRRANVLISHAGMGTIGQAIEMCKTVIVVPRKSKLGEHFDDHQFVTTRHMEAESKLLAAYEIDDLPEKLEQAKTFSPIRNGGSEEILHAVQDFIDNVAAKKAWSVQREENTSSATKLWPYRILKREDDDIKADLLRIMRYFEVKGSKFDTIVFVPYAGYYLGKLFVETFDNSFDVNFITVRRLSTISKDNFIKKFVFRRKWLSDITRHLDVLLRLIKYKLGISQKMVAEPTIDFDVRGKKVLVIDDDIATGTTLAVVKSTLLRRGASSVITASISNHFLPDEIEVDYSVYRYKLLRTKNSRDYYAT